MAANRSPSKAPAAHRSLTGRLNQAPSNPRYPTVWDGLSRRNAALLLGVTGRFDQGCAILLGMVEQPLRPSGTVTFLFTDVEGSTSLWDSEPGPRAAALERHDGVLREVIDGHGGYVFSTAGDSFAAAFGRAADALSAAADLTSRLADQSWETSVPIRVRVGVHTGEAQERDGDFFGPAVNRAARVMAAGHGGQVLVSESTVSVVGAAAVGPKLGDYVIRGFAEPLGVSQLGEGDFPALRTEDTATAGNLPEPVGDLVGRTGAVAEVVALARRVEFVTVLGPGGMGKTRLAVEAAGELSADCVDGGWFVDLASASTSEAVVHLAIEALGVRANEGEDLHAAVVRHLLGRRAVVVLDNCEHVLDGAAELASALLSGAPTVALLATSRERLDVDGEQVWPLEGLSSDGGGVELFVQRARAIDPRFELADSATVAELCGHLDGMPLAIELAAARVGSMTPEELLAHLGDRFRLLRASGRRGRGARGASTLRETVGWSYRLLEPEVQLMMSRLSVFPASFTVDDAVAVCAGDELDRLDVVEFTSELVDKSLLVADRSGPVTRYRMLETIRAFGQEVLGEAGARDSVQLAFAVHVRDWLVETLSRLEGAGDLDAVVELDRGWVDLREAVSWALSVDDVDLAVELTAGLGFEAQLRERREAREWLWKVVEMNGAQDHRRAAELLAAASIMDWLVGDYETGYSKWEQVEAIRSEREEPINVQVAIAAAQHCSFRGEHDRTQRTLSDLLAEAHVTGNVFCEATLLMTLGISSAYTGQSTNAEDYANQLRSLAERLDNGSVRVAAAYLETISRVDANPDRSVMAARSAIAMAEQARMPWYANAAANYLIWGLLQTGQVQQAVPPIQDVLEEMSKGAAIQGLAITARMTVVLLAQQGRHHAAATVAGWLVAQDAGTPGTPGMRDRTTETIDSLPSHLGRDEYNAATAHGAQLTAEQLIEHALVQIGQLTPHPEMRPAPQH